MALMLDADVIIRGERGTFDLNGWIDLHSKDRIEIAAITVAELWHGVERASVAYRQEREKYLRAIVEEMPIIPYSEQTAYHHARIWAALEAAGEMIEYYDLIVAATALERGSVVATFDVRHFSRVKGLTVVAPS